MAHALFHIPWGDMLLPKPSWAEKLVRPFFIYLILLLIFRFGAKRALAQSTLFDFLVILLISNVVQNAMIGDDSSILGATAGAVILVVLSDQLNLLAAHSRKWRHKLEGMPIMLLRNGVVDEDMMRKQGISRGDLCLAIRKQGLTRLADVQFALMELDGSISVIPRDNDDPRPHDCMPPELVGAESSEHDCWDDQKGDWNP